MSSPAAALTAAAASVRRRAPSMAQRESVWGFIFLLPWLLGFLVFTLIPMGATLTLSFTNFSLSNLGNVRFIGIDNYVRLLRDPLVPHSLGVTLKFGALALPLAVLIPLGMAVLLNARYLFAKSLFRTLFYMPYIVPLVSSVLIWSGFLNSQTGWLNAILARAGIAGPDWINSTTWIYPALLIVGLWGNGNAMLTLLAGMQGVPSELYEAARVDGAGPLTMFFRITVPLITPVIFYNLILAIIGLFQYFLEPYVLTNGTGDPGNATMFYNLYLFKNFFTYQDMAYGATLAWVLFVIILAATGLLFATQRFWVYQAEER